MADQDLSKLKIDKTEVIKGPVGNRKKNIYGAAVAAFVILISVLFLGGFLRPAMRVQAVSVSQIYPSQTLTLLNASGYVVAQRKAALASKITGRIIQLNVEEGSRVKEGDIIARLESNECSSGPRSGGCQYESGSRQSRKRSGES